MSNGLTVDDLNPLARQTGRTWTMTYPVEIERSGIDLLTTRRIACSHARMAAAKRVPVSARASGRPRAGGADKEPLQVRIPVAVKRRFKSHAALRGLEPHELFVEMWERYEASLKSETGQGRGN